ncbi:MAG: zf-HC2 domain-containing protein [Coprococcus sp.]
MKKNECYIVQDLLPIYIDHVCSKQTAEFVECHLQSCENCKKIHEEMSSDVSLTTDMPEFNSRQIFCHAKKSILGIIIALAAVISCFGINTGDAWMGGDAGVLNMVVTALYIIFWSIFSVWSKGYEPLVKFSFVISTISFISAITGLGARVINFGGFITGIIGAISAIQFYGFTYFTGWTGLYAVATVLSLVWLIYNWNSKRKLKLKMGMETNE